MHHHDSLDAAFRLLAEGTSAQSQLAASKMKAAEITIVDEALTDEVLDKARRVAIELAKEEVFSLPFPQSAFLCRELLFIAWEDGAFVRGRVVSLRDRISVPATMSFDQACLGAEGTLQFELDDGVLESEWLDFEWSELFATHVAAFAGLHYASAGVTKRFERLGRVARKQAARRRRPVFEYHLLSIDHRKLKFPRIVRGGTHTSPREHERKAHPRTLKSGKKVLISACTVSAGSQRGKIKKDYLVLP